jgi:hypothetical protein
METVSRSYLLVPRPDLSSPIVDVVDWRLRAHDGAQIRGLRGQSPFHSVPRGARIRQAGLDEELTPCLETVTEGCVDFVYHCGPERRLEDRVLDALRVWQAALNAGVAADAVSFVHPTTPSAPDEFMIAAELLRMGMAEHLAQ